jgi:hypothetical protein
MRNVGVVRLLLHRERDRAPAVLGLPREDDAAEPQYG